MKEAMDSTPARVEDDQDNFANRKLIRPALSRVDHTHGNPGNHITNNQIPGLEHRDRPPRHDRPDRNLDRSFERADRRERNDRSQGEGRKSAPPEQTNAENFYYQKQMQSRTPMVVVLRDGEEVHGIIEWYDKTCIKIVREDGAPNLVIYKPAIKYMFKEEESGR
jgi:sRNA-binding regulator protein Hfq